MEIPPFGASCQILYIFEVKVVIKYFCCCYWCYGCCCCCCFCCCCFYYLFTIFAAAVAFNKKVISRGCSRNQKQLRQLKLGGEKGFFSSTMAAHVRCNPKTFLYRSSWLVKGRLCKLHRSTNTCFQKNLDGQHKILRPVDFSIYRPSQYFLWQLSPL